MVRRTSSSLASQDQGEPRWKEKAAAKRASTYAKIPKEWRLSPDTLDDASQQRDLTGPYIESFLTHEEVVVTELESVSLLAKIKSGDISALSVTKAFCKRTALAQQLNNCLHEIFFDQALERAKQLDEQYTLDKSAIGPLHGLPVSLKDQFHVKGNDTSMGFIGWLDTFEGKSDPSLIRSVNSQIVLELVDLGAVLYCKTTLPQTLIFGETVNNLIGTTLNPHNMNLSCGGSSGGEGALAALGGSPCGVGTDIGGSVRIPAAFCGIYSLKPTHNRLSYRDVGNVNPGQTTYASSVGVMSRDLDSLHLLMTSILSQRPWLRDPHVIPIAWRGGIVNDTLKRVREDGSAKSREALKLGILDNDGMVTPHPPIQRGLRLVAEALEKAGHTILSWKPPPHEQAQKIHGVYLSADGGFDIQNQLKLSGEPLIPPLRRSQDRKPVPITEYQSLTVEARDYEAAYSDYWNSTAGDGGQIADAFIAPVAPHAAVIPGRYMHVAYSEVINLLDYTALVIPVTRADKKIDQQRDDFEPLNAKDMRNWEAYDPDIYDGAPVGLQIVGRKYEEEKIWAIAKIVRAVLQTAGIE